MTPEQTAILDAMPEGSVTVRQLARRAWGNDNAKSMGQLLRRLESDGYVSRQPRMPKNVTRWVKVKDAVNLGRPGITSVRVPVTTPASSTADSLYVSVSLPQAPWEVGA